MRFREITSLLLLLSLVLTLFTSCKSGNTDSSNSDAGSTEQTVNIKQRVNFERYKKINYQKSTLKLRLVVKKLMVQKGYSKAGVR